MNPLDHTGRHSSPWIEAAESADVIDRTDTESVDVTHVLPAPVSAAGLRMATGLRPAPSWWARTFKGER